MKNFFRNKKFKYGSLGLGITVAAIALIIIVNIIFSALSGTFRWYFDMTSEQFYHVSDETKAYLDEIDPEFNDVTLYFLAPADSLTQAASASNYAQSSSLWGMKYIYNLALELADEYSFISVDHINITTEPDRLREIVGDEYFEAMTFTRYYVIVDNYTVERDSDGVVLYNERGETMRWHNYRVYSRNAFYTFDYSSSYYTVTGFKGDYRFCSAITSLCEEVSPVVYLITGHGEEVGAYTPGTQNSDYGQALYLCQIFNDSGCNIRKIDLQHEDFGNEKCAIAVIFSPQTDYSSSAEVENHNELGKLSAFLERDGHSLMVMFDSGNQTLPNLEKYLETNCGVSVGGLQIKDNGENSIDVNMLQIVGSPNDDSSTPGGEIASRLADSDISGKIVFPNARALTVTDSAKASAICYVPSTAYVERGGAREYFGEKSAALATVTDLGHGSFVFCTGTTGSSDVYFADSPVYANNNFYLSLIDRLSTSIAPFGVEYKIITSEGLDLTKREAITQMIIISAAIPLVVLAAGTVVYIRRRHS